MLPWQEDERKCPASPASSAGFFSFPDSDDSPPAWRQKVEEVWKEQDEMVRMIEAASEVVTTNVHSSASMLSHSSTLPASSSSSSRGEWWPTQTDTRETRLRKLKNIWVEQDALVADLMTGSQVPALLDPIEEFEADATDPMPKEKKERPVKYGRCPEHRLPLYPHLHTSPQARAWGCIYMRCPKFKERNAMGKPSCWFARLLTEDDKQKVPKAILEDQRQIKANVAWQLRNAS